MNLLTALDSSIKNKESNRIFLTESGEGYEVQTTKHVPHAVSVKHIFQKAAEQIKDLSIPDFRQMESLVGKLHTRLQEGRVKHSIFYKIFTFFCYRGAVNAYSHLKECISARNAELKGFTSSGTKHTTLNFKIPATNQAARGFLKATEDMGSLVVMGLSKSNKDSGNMCADKVARSIFNDIDNIVVKPEDWLKHLKKIVNGAQPKFGGMPANVNVTFVAFRTFPKKDNCRVVGVSLGDNAVCIRKKDDTLTLISPPTTKAMGKIETHFKFSVPALPNKLLEENDFRYFDVECSLDDSVAALSHKVLDLSIPSQVEFELSSDAGYDTTDFKLLQRLTQKKQNELLEIQAKEKLQKIQLSQVKDFIIEARAQTSKSSTAPAQSAPSSTGAVEPSEDEERPKTA